MVNNIFSFIDISKLWSFDFNDIFVPEVFWSLIIILLLISLSLIVYFVFKKALKDPLKTPNKFVIICMDLVKVIEKFTVDVMGEKNRSFSGYVLAIGVYLLLSFLWGLLGFDSPVTYLAVPLSLALMTFILIHATAIKTNKLKYFKRYIEPFPLFLPINLVSMWSPLISMTFRIFGNAVAGYCIMTIAYFGLQTLSSFIFTGSTIMGPASIVIAPFITPILNLYFYLFSGAVQTLLFIMLTMINIYQEQGDDPEEVLEEAIIN